MASSLHLPGGFEHGLAHTDVGAATAEIAAESLFDLMFVLGIRMPVEESLGRHDESRGAVAALLGVMIHECHGHRMGPGGRPDSFNGLDILALRVDRKHGATIDHL